MESIIDYLRELESKCDLRAEEARKDHNDIGASYEDGYLTAIIDIWNFVSAEKFEVEDAYGRPFIVVDAED